MRRLSRVLARTALAVEATALLPRLALAQAAQDPPAARAAARVYTLAELERAALERQPQVRIARAATRIAQAQAEQARSPLFPQLLATASYTRQTGNFVPRPGAIPGSFANPPSPSLTRSFDYWSVGVSGTQLIYDFGQTPQRAEAAASTADAQRLAEQTTRVQIVAAIRRAYFGARATRELVDVAQRTLEDQNHHLAQVQGFVEVGTQPPIALAQQRASVANAQVQLLTAQNNHETAKAQLNQAAGIAGGTDYVIGDDELPPVDEEDQPLEGLVVKALAVRPELAALSKQREAQEESLHSVRGGYGPTFSAAAGATDAGNTLDNLVPNWTAGLLMTWAFFQGGLTNGQVHQAEASLESIDAQRSLQELQVRLDVDSARLALRAAKATIGAALDAVAAAREQLRLAEQRYATGVGSILELTDAQVSYSSAAAQAVQARYGLSSARAQLLAALGRT